MSHPTYHVNMRDYIDRRVTSPSLGPHFHAHLPIKAEQKNTSLEDALIDFNQREEFPPAVTRAG